ncbi:hypothetical protein GCWU000322_00060 [Eubacterium saphenum ATCC 49989]|nr:hypothetical protein GCWU000322_00060 [Eubacterium saphenum ATCC 49989]
MSQKQLATQLGYQPECGTIYKLETGKTKLPVDKLCKLAEILETTPNWLLGWGGGGENVEISTPATVSEPASAATLSLHLSDDPTSEAVGAVLVSSTGLSATDLLAVKSTSDSLAPTVGEGDTVILSESGRVRNTSIVLANIGDTADFRRVLISDDVTLLIADDKDIKPVPLTANTKLYGTVVEIRKVIT